MFTSIFNKAATPTIPAVTRVTRRRRREHEPNSGISSPRPRKTRRTPRAPRLGCSLNLWLHTFIATNNKHNLSTLSLV